MADISDRELILQLQQGSLEALGMLFDRYRQMVYRTALAITGDAEAASDLLQDVFLRLHRFAERIDSQRPIEPWLYRMTANLAYTWVKRNHRWVQPLEDLAEWLAGTSRNTPLDLAELQDDWDQVQQAVTALPISQRLVVVLYYLNDLPIQDIAEILDVPAGTVKSRLHYGRLALQKSLGIGQEQPADWNYERT
ncbi:MAG TPA: RNA polymerase sigma factor [Anaerolineales bacterium]